MQEEKYHHKHPQEAQKDINKKNRKSWKKQQDFEINFCMYRTLFFILQQVFNIHFDYLNYSLTCVSDICICYYYS